MTLCSDVEQISVAINNGMITRAKLVAPFTRAIAHPVHMERQMQLPME